MVHCNAPGRYMAYAIIQKELRTPDVERLMRAFRTLPNLRDFDAQTAAHGANGIFLRGLDVESASFLQDALLREGVDTVVVKESELPSVPPAKIVRQMELLPEHLTMYDPMRRAFSVPWSEILFIAAGNVRVQELRRAKPVPELMHSRAGVTANNHTNDAKSRPDLRYHLMLDIVLRDGVTRYSVDASDFVFDYAGTGFTQDVPTNFALLVQDLAKFAPHAGLNRGAVLLCKQAEEVFAYPSKAAFFDEITWMLWRIGTIARREEI